MMKVKKNKSAKAPGYPSRREFLATAGAAVLGLGAVACVAADKEGAAKGEEIRRRGNIAVDPGEAGCKTNVPGGAAGSTNAAPAEKTEPRLEGLISVPREPVRKTEIGPAKAGK